MNAPTSLTWIAFAGKKRIGRGSPRETVSLVKAFVDAHADAQVLVLDARSSQLTDVDLRGTLAAVLRRLPREPAAQPPAVAADEGQPSRGPGRPKLGVVAREVTLLPRHWDWLATQPGGASVALRKLVEHAQRASKASDQAREARDSAYRFMHAVAGNEPGFEEASRALFASDIDKLRTQVAKWPRDIRDHVLTLAEHALPKPNVAESDAAR